MAWELYEGNGRAKVKANGEEITVIEIERDQGRVRFVYGRITRSGTERERAQKGELSLADIEFDEP